MRRLLLLALIISLSLSCKKKKLEIIYPASMTYGENLLKLDVIQDGTHYSMGAKLGKKAELKVVITNLSFIADSSMAGPLWFLPLASQNGWAISTYNETDGIQTFTSTNDGEIDVEIFFLYGSNGSGLCRVDYYENSTTITRSKHLNW